MSCGIGHRCAWILQCCSSHSTPSLGTSICCECGPKKQKKKKKRSKISNKSKIRKKIVLSYCVGSSVNWYSFLLGEKFGSAFVKFKYRLLIQLNPSLGIYAMERRETYLSVYCSICCVYCSIFCCSKVLEII